MASNGCVSTFIGLLGLELVLNSEEILTEDEEEEGLDLSLHGEEGYVME